MERVIAGHTIQRPRTTANWDRCVRSGSISSRRTQAVSHMMGVELALLWLGWTTKVDETTAWRSFLVVGERSQRVVNHVSS